MHQDYERANEWSAKVIDNCLIVELKAVEVILPIHKAKLMSYILFLCDLLLKKVRPKGVKFSYV